MKKMKKIISVLAAMIMVLAMSVPVLAAADEETTYTLTIKDATAGNTYNAYQIFKGRADTVNGEVILSDVEWGSGVDTNNLLAAVKAIGGIDGAFKDCGSAADVANVLANAKDDSQLVDQFVSVVAQHLSTTKVSVTAAIPTDETAAKAEFSGDTALTAGYYLIQSTKTVDENTVVDAKSKIMLKVVGNSEIEAKEDDENIPDVTKTAGDNGDSSISASIGDPITFKIEGTMPANLDQYAAYKYEFTDTPSAGLDIDKNTVTVTHYTSDSDTSGTDVKDTGNNNGFTVNYNETDRKLTVSCNDVKKITDVTADSKFVVTYTAKLNTNAVTTGTNGLPANSTANNSNKVTLEYSNDPTNGGTGTTASDPGKEVTITTYQFDIFKYTGTDANKTGLAGANFTLKDTNNNEINFTGSDGVYTVCESGTHGAVTTLESPANGKITIKGLAAGDYTLKETAAPSGYNSLGDTITVGVHAGTDPNADKLALTQKETNGKEDAASVTQVEVENNKGAVLPSTGGTGTTIFYIVGAILVIGAAVLLVVRKRMSAEK